MVARIRRAIQTGVDLIRGTMATVNARSVPDLAILIQAEAMHEAALVLQDNFINPDPKLFAAVVQEIRHHIGGLDAARMRGDVSGLDGIKNRVSRAICEEQLDLIDRLHLLQAVVLGAEQGLRDLIEVRPVSDRRIRDGPGSGGERKEPSTSRHGAAAKSGEPSSVTVPVIEEGLPDPKREAVTKDHRSHDESDATARSGKGANLKGRAKVERPSPVLPDPGRNGLAQHGGDAGMKPIAADTADL